MNRSPVPPPARRTPPQQAPRRTPAKKRLRPGIKILLVLLVIALCVTVFLVVYNATRTSLEQKPGEPQGTQDNPPQEENPQIPEPEEPEQPEEPEPAPAPAPVKPAPAVALSSLNDIVNYVDSLGIDYSNLASFNMNGYFSDAMLAETADAGVAFADETVYIGDSLVLHMGVRSSHPKDMVYAAASINPEDACTKNLATLKDGTECTFAAAMREKQPKRIVITIGTNSMWMEPSVYLYFFSQFIDQLQSACPNAEIILQSTPPLSAEYEVGKNFPTNAKINRFNLYLAGLASFRGVWFLNSAPELKGADGTLKAEYDNDDGYHITQSAYETWLTYLRFHATTLQ